MVLDKRLFHHLPGSFSTLIDSLRYFRSSDEDAIVENSLTISNYHFLRIHQKELMEASLKMLKRCGALQKK